MWVITIPWWVVALCAISVVSTVLMVSVLRVSGRSKEKERLMRKDYTDNEQ